MEKKTFLFYTSWKKNIEIMDDVELRRFINNLINYTEGNQIDLPTRIDKMVWNDVVELLDHNETKRQKTIERRREAGKKGGAPVGNSNAQKKIEVEETTKNNQNNQLVEKQPKQPDICNMIYDEGYMKKEEGNMIYVEGNMLKDEGYMKNDIRNKLLDIMKQVIEEGYIKKEEVLNWRLNDTREMLNDIFIDYPNWEKDLMKFGLDGFVMRMDKFTKVEPDYIVINTLRAHSIL
jgi:hypothetical protein